MARRKKEAEITPQEQEKENDSNMAENEAMLFADNENLPLDTVENAVNEPEIDTAENEKNALTENVNEPLEAIEANEPESLPEPVQPKNKRGRKSIDGEIRKNKITVYLTDTQNEDFTALISLKHARSAADYVLGLITGEIAKNEKALYFFREAEKYTQ